MSTTMSALPKRYFTVEEYLLLEERSPYKSQWVAGEIFPMGECTTGHPSAMGGAQPNNVRIVDNISAGLHLRFRGRSCESFSSAMRVAVDRGEMYTYPDVSALCGEPKFNTRHNPPSLINPQVIFEVLSPSAEAFDRGDKFERYQQLESLTDYVLLSVERMHVEHFTREPNGRWQFTIYSQPEQRRTLASVGCELPLGEIYERVTFPSSFP